MIKEIVSEIQLTPQHCNDWID